MSQNQAAYIVLFGGCDDIMSWSIALFAGVPEVLSTIACTVLFLGGRESFNLKKSNLLRLLLTVFICLSFTWLLKSVFGNYQYINNFVVQLIFYMAVISRSYKIEWYYTSISLILVFICFSILEFANFMFIQALGYSVEDFYSNDFLRIILFLPLHALQLALSVVIYKIPHTLISVVKIKKLSNNLKKRFTAINVCLFLAFVSIIITFKVFIFDLKLDSLNILMMVWINMGVILILAGALILTGHKSTKAIKEEKENNVVQLFWFRSLVNKNDDIAEIREKIDEKVKNREGA